MGNNKIVLSEEVVKYLFSGVDCEIALGEDGYVVYGFQFSYPSKLGLFIPIEIDRSNYNALFPKNFEAYFKSMDDEFAYLSRLLEFDIRNEFLGYGIEYIPGAVLRRSDDNYTIFRFDELMQAEERVDLLCRVQSDNLNLFSRLMDMKLRFLAETSTLDNRIYFYFILPIERLFRIDDGMIAAIFSFLQSLRKK